MKRIFIMLQGKIENLSVELPQLPTPALTPLWLDKDSISLVLSLLQAAGVYMSLNWGAVCAIVSWVCSAEPWIQFQQFCPHWEQLKEQLSREH